MIGRDMVAAEAIFAAFVIAELGLAFAHFFALFIGDCSLGGLATTRGPAKN